MDQILPVFGEARSDYEIFSSLAQKLGFESEFTEHRSESDWIRFLFEETRKQSIASGSNFPDFDSFVQKGHMQVESAEEPSVMLESFRKNPKKSPLRTPSGKIEIFSDTIHSFGYLDCPGHATWMEPSEWLGNEGISDDVLHLISNQPASRLHSQLDHGRYSQSYKINGREPLRLNTNEAGKRGIAQGDTVRVYNERGAFLASANVDDNLRSGVVQIATGAWFDPEDPDAELMLCKHGNPNIVTHDRSTSSLSQGPSALSCLVKVKKVTSNAPDVTAFKPPDFVD